MYGVSGVAIICFAGGNIWRLEAQVLGRLTDEEAMEFRKSLENESTMVSIAVSTPTRSSSTDSSLSLAGLSQAHWIARGLLALALVASLMAVYYATTLQRTIGLLITAPQLRQWIRGVSWGDSRYFSDPVDLEFERLFQQLSQISAHAPSAQTIVSRYCFTPSLASVLTIAAPRVLLATSVLKLLIGLGTYLGFTWTRDLDSGASSSDSRNVFIMYVVGFGVCFAIYYLPQLLQDPELYSPRRALDEYCLKFFKSAPGEIVL
ncbi:hypothetical protein K505DRAFT_238083 [Melanomma pulvis-pyrius CBS 109.77]|uniref:Uncharacterized protein n=1 Tax=Melanomma pulvis-pyrius CBS 109.77 TaxID=1314802 RepID=A0A6A6XIM0_9PLEO|nr:hypothetical protein K505DRAFT_238083 [Melanomma pulvis-pyrius CBS 109.77]